MGKELLGKMNTGFFFHQNPNILAFTTHKTNSDYLYRLVLYASFIRTFWQTREQIPGIRQKRFGWHYIHIYSSVYYKSFEKLETLAKTVFA